MVRLVHLTLITVIFGERSAVCESMTEKFCRRNHNSLFFYKSIVISALNQTKTKIQRDGPQYESEQLLSTTYPFIICSHTFIITLHCLLESRWKNWAPAYDLCVLNNWTDSPSACSKDVGSGRACGRLGNVSTAVPKPRPPQGYVYIPNTATIEMIPSISLLLISTTQHLL